MQKSLSIELFNLIKTLDKGEKRHFKLYASLYNSSTNKVYLKIFDVLCKQKVYSKENLLKHIGNVKNLSKHKRYLFDLLLESLANYHQKNSNTIHIRSLINQVDVTFRKGLYSTALALTNQLKKLAKEQEELVFLIDASRIESQLIDILKSNDYESLDKVYQEEADALEELMEIRALQRTASRTGHFLLVEGISRNEEEKNAWITNQLAENKIINQQFNPEKSIRRNSMLTFIQCQLRRTDADRTACIESCEKMFGLFEKITTPLTPKKVALYSSHLGNYVTLCIENREYQKALEGLEKLKNFNYKSKPNERASLQFYYSNKLSLLYRTGNTIAAKDFVHEAEKSIEKYNFRQSSIVVIQANIMLIYWLLYEDYTRSLVWCNHILNEKLNARKDIYCMSKIIFLLIHLEKNNTELVESSLKSTSTYLKKRNKFYKVEKEMISFIASVCKITSIDDEKEKEKKECYKKLKIRLEPLYADATKKNIAVPVDFISWAESKIRKKPYVEVLKEKLAVEQATIL